MPKQDWMHRDDVYKGIISWLQLRQKAAIVLDNKQEHEFLTTLIVDMDTAITGGNELPWEYLERMKKL